MAAFTSSTVSHNYSFTSSSHTDKLLTSLFAGEVIVETKAHTAWGAAVTAQMYLPLRREKVWNQLIDYPQWVHYFPDVTQSQVVAPGNPTESGMTCGKRLYQVARKSFLFFTAEAEIYLRVVEVKGQQIQFDLESGSFTDFSANLKLKDFKDGTLLTYYVQATPVLPIPTVFIQQAILFDLPSNMRTMRQVILDQYCNEKVA